MRWVGGGDVATLVAAYVLRQLHQADCGVATSLTEKSVSFVAYERYLVFEEKFHVPGFQLKTLSCFYRDPLFMWTLMSVSKRESCWSSRLGRAIELLFSNFAAFLVTTSRKSRCVIPKGSFRIPSKHTFTITFQTLHQERPILRRSP